MRIFMSAIGSLGDVNPIISLGTALRERGHEIRVLCTADAEQKVRDAGLSAHCVLGQREYDRWRRLPREAEADRENVKALLYVAAPALAESMRVIWRQFVPGKSMGLGPAMTCLAYPFAREKLRMPVVEIQYSPRVHKDGDEFDTIFGKALNDVRNSIRLPPIASGLLRWLLTFDASLGLYPDWFLHAPGEQPASVDATDFLFEQSDDAHPLPAELEQFLDAGTPPLAITFGSYATTDPQLYANMIRACQAMQERLVIITKYPEQLPQPLPPNCIQVAYVSLQRLFPRVRAAVHHGGAGTMAQAFRAGVPQLVCPMAFDQFVNADRVVALGSGLRLDRTTFFSSRLQQTVARLRDEAPFAATARTLAQQFGQADPRVQICGKVEQYAARFGVQR